MSRLGLSVSDYIEVTKIYPLPKLPDRWLWKVWRDRVDGVPKTFVRLSDAVGHCAGHGVVDDDSVVELAVDLMERAGL